MPETLLQMKMNIPPLRPNLVPRPHLVQRLNQGLHLGHKLALVSAPAGFGKTTLVREWVNQKDEGRGVKDENNDIHPSAFLPQPSSVAWLSLDERDGDLARFLVYIIAVLNQIIGTGTTVGEGVLAMLQSPQPPPIEDLLTPLINELAPITGKIILVLDDYHLTESAAVDVALTFFLEHLPPPLHLVIVTRVEPDLQVARLRARGHLTELRALDLRFTVAEATQFLNTAMGLDLSPAEIAALEKRTEGWISGLQLAAISMRGHEDATGFVDSFSGSHHFVLDYLIEEVLEQQPDSLQRFLLQTAVLDRLNGSLCDAVCFDSGGSIGTATTGQETLEALEHANLFVIPLDEERHWYRYHHLFSDLLRQRLQQKHPDWLSLLHKRAGEWYGQNGFVDEAIEHTIRAGAFERTARLIEEHAEVIWKQGEHTKLHRWLAALPADLVHSKPQLAVFHAWDKFAAGQQDAAERSLQALELALEPGRDKVAGSSQAGKATPADLYGMNLRGRISAIRAFMAAHRSESEETIEHASRALEYLPAQELSWRSAAAVALGDAYVFSGDYRTAHQVRLEAMQTSKAAGNIYLFMVASLKFALNLRAQGRLQQAIEICRDRFVFATEKGMAQTNIVGWLLAIWGEVLAERDELERALDLVSEGVDLTERGRDVAMLGWSYLCLVRVLYTRGEWAGSEETIRKLEDVAREYTVPPWISKLAAAWQIRLWLAQDRLDIAVAWVRERNLDPKKRPTHVDALEYIALARILINQGEPDKATRLLRRLLEPAEAGGHTTRAIELLLLQSLALWTQGKTEQSAAALGQAISQAKPGGYVRIFVDEGSEMAHLLTEAIRSGKAPVYGERLLSAFPVAGSEQFDSLKTQAGTAPLVEALSERETEVLQLIAKGLSNREIATRLFLSVHTVKSHTRNIYGKLDVHNRVAAVDKGKKLRILPPT